MANKRNEKNRLAEEVLEKSGDFDENPDPKYAERAEIPDEGFPLKDYRMSIRVDAELREEINRAAKKYGLPVQTFFKMAVKRFIEIDNEMQKQFFAEKSPEKRSSNL